MVDGKSARSIEKWENNLGPRLREDDRLHCNSLKNDVIPAQAGIINQMDFY